MPTYKVMFDVVLKHGVPEHIIEKRFKPEVEDMAKLKPGLAVGWEKFYIMPHTIEVKERRNEYRSQHTISVRESSELRLRKRPLSHVKVNRETTKDVIEAMGNLD